MCRLRCIRPVFYDSLRDLESHGLHTNPQSLLVQILRILHRRDQLPPEHPLLSLVRVGLLLSNCSGPCGLGAVRGHYQRVLGPGDLLADPADDLCAPSVLVHLLLFDDIVVYFV